MLDLHCHILYGVDDGAPTRDVSLEMLDAASSAGFDTVVATPHIRGRYGDETLIRERYGELVPEAEARGITLLLGYEMHFRSVPERMDRIGEFCIAGTDALLLEFDYTGGSRACDQAIYAIRKAGFDVIVAHPERYEYVQNDLTVAERWCDQGCRLQLDGYSFGGGPFDKAARTARRLAEKGMADFIATDAHRADGYTRFLRATKKLDLTKFSHTL